MIDGDVSSGLSKTRALSRSNPLDVSGELVSGDKAFAKVWKNWPTFDRSRSSCEYSRSCDY